MQIMHEILSQTLINPAEVEGESEGWHTTSDTLHNYAKSVQNGYREKMPDKWPATIRALIEQCWNQVGRVWMCVREVGGEMNMGRGSRVSACVWCVGSRPLPELPRFSSVLGTATLL
jgi:hypothetical protein